MSKNNNNSRNGSKHSCEVYVVNFKTKQVEFAFIGESDKVILNCVQSHCPAPIKNRASRIDVSDYENVLRFHQKAA